MGADGEPTVDDTATADDRPPPDPAPGRLTAVAAGPRLAPLDGMRAVFLLVVMAHHVVWTAPKLATGWVPGAWAALDGFFVLSGFLIGGLLLRELSRTGSVRYATFMGRRLLRLYPAMIVALAAMAAVSLVQEHVPWRDAPSDPLAPLGAWPTIRACALYVMNWPFGRNQRVLIEYTHFWSLAVEFHFYLLLPILLWALVRARVRPMGQLGALLGVIGLIWWERTRVWTGPASFPAAYVFSWTRADTLVWGVVVALVLQQGWIDDRHRTLLRGLAVPALAWTVWVVYRYEPRSAFVYDWLMTVSGITNSILLAWVLVDGRSLLARTLGSRPLTWLGARTYSLYLYHYPVFFWSGRHLRSLGEPVRLVAAVAIAVGLADLSYRLVERPTFALKDRLLPSRVRAPAPPAMRST